MPDQNNRLTRQDLLRSLQERERNITNFEPPSANPQSTDPNTAPPVPNLARIKREIADQAASERTEALFKFLEDFIAQGCRDEIAHQQITQTVAQLRSEFTDLNNRVVAVEDILSRNGLT